MTIADVVGITVVTKHVAAGETPGDLRVSKAFGMQQTRPATWEGSVLPALREALNEHPITRGAKVKILETTPDAFDVEVTGDGWAGLGQVGRESLEDVDASVQKVAYDAREQATRARIRPLTCPVCQALGWWRPRCGACEVAALVQREPEQTASES